MNEKNKLSDINVKMGSHNTVGHIGHIVYEAPPPRPNAIMQNEVDVGVFVGQPKFENNKYIFSKLCFDRPPYNDQAPFKIQSVTLRCINFGVSNLVSFGTVASLVLVDAVCEVVT